MRAAQKKKAENFVDLLNQAHEEIKSRMEQRSYGIALDLLAQCQDGAIHLCDFIQKTEGEDAPAVSFLIEYYKQIYQIHEELIGGMAANADMVYEKLQRFLTPAKNSIKNDIKVKLEIAFLPYKASMWDSLESVWMAADADTDCTAYVVPIPYYERNSDGSIGAYHYEGGDMPEYVPVVHYDDYHLPDRQPDIIYIHNPYDQDNFVTTVDPRYYSSELKKYTQLLVYIPYFSTSGGMSEGQSLCRAYLNVDYIVVQAEKYKDFYDRRIPREKLLPLGSPKFDKVIRLCQNPPEPPENWKKHLDGKKVYFYNTSINGMLADTRRFLLKMEYVFKCFQGRNDACLLWRPHPLMDSTFDSMRKEYKPVYDELRRKFIDNDYGIYDDTPDIEKTIALCDAYIGDSGTSVTALFGIVGKPLFILNNFINTLPEEDDWRGEIISGFFADGQDEWIITQGNKLYHSPAHDYHYEFYCDLSEYSSGYYYHRAVEIEGMLYVCPRNAQDILVISEHKIVKKIALTRHTEQWGAFCNTMRVDNYLFLIPYKYPAIVRYDVKSGILDYIEGYNDIFIKKVQNEWIIGGACIWKNKLLLASPADDKVLMIDSAELKVELSSSGISNSYGCLGMTPYDDGICMLPYMGTNVICWNPDTGAAVEYSDMPKGFQCNNRWLGFLCTKRPFNLAAVYQKEIVLPPMWGNMFLSINMETGTVQEWEPPFAVSWEGRNCYFQADSIGAFSGRTDTLGEGTYRFVYGIDRRIYDINLKTREFKEIEIVFNKDEVLEHEPGFGKNSEWQKYGCEEKALYSLKDFLDGIEIGRPFDRGKQIQIYREIAENTDGTCGDKIHRSVCANLYKPKDRVKL